MSSFVSPNEITSAQSLITSAVVAAIQASVTPVGIDANGAINAGYDGASFAPASVTSAAVIFTQDMTGYGGICIHVLNAGTSCTITYDTSENNTNFLTIAGQSISVLSPAPLATTSTTAGGIVFPKRFKYFRARVSTYGSGTVTVLYSLLKYPPQLFAGA